MGLKELIGKASTSLALKSRSQEIVKRVARPNFHDPKWRRLTWPGCPACQLPPQLTVCGAAALWVPPGGELAAKWLPASMRCGGDLYLDTETGLVHCAGCDSRQALAETKYACSGSCGAVFEGGECWEGMKADLPAMRSWAWTRTVKARLSQRILDCGYDRMTRLVKTSPTPRCGCKAKMYRLDGVTDICGECLRRWPADLGPIHPSRDRAQARPIPHSSAP